MQNNGQHITKGTYEDPEIVEAYIKRNTLQPKQANLIRTFATTINGKRVLDLGCGPGHYTYLFSELGFDVTGLDYSHEMIKKANNFKKIKKNIPEFIVADMKKLTDHYSNNTFDAIWASASLIHIRPKNLDSVLKGMTKIVKPNAKIFISLKDGEGTLLVDENKLGKPMQREFTLWSKEKFLKKIMPYGWLLDSFFSEDGSIFMGQPTRWLQFFFTVPK